MIKLIIKNKIFIVIRNNELHSNIDFTTKTNDYGTHIIDEVKSLALYLFVCVSKKQTNCRLFKLRTNWLND